MEYYSAIRNATEKNFLKHATWKKPLAKNHTLCEWRRDAHKRQQSKHKFRNQKPGGQMGNWFGRHRAVASQPVMENQLSAQSHSQEIQR
jgi:hypothetical protein